MYLENQCVSSTFFQRFSHHSTPNSIPRTSEHALSSRFLTFFDRSFSQRGVTLLAAPVVHVVRSNANVNSSARVSVERAKPKDPSPGPLNSTFVRTSHRTSKRGAGEWHASGNDSHSKGKIKGAARRKRSRETREGERRFVYASA